MFLSSEIIIENVMLRTQTETSTDFLNVMTNVKPINKCRSTCWREKPCIIQQSSDTYHKSTSNCRHHAFKFLSTIYHSNPYWTSLVLVTKAIQITCQFLAKSRNVVEENLYETHNVTYHNRHV